MKHKYPGENYGFIIKIGSIHPFCVTNYRALRIAGVLEPIPGWNQTFLWGDSACHCTTGVPFKTQFWIQKEMLVFAARELNDQHTKNACFLPVHLYLST